MTLEFKEIELLRTKGLLTSRGIFEFFLIRAGFELKAEQAKKGLDVTSACSRIDEIIDKNISTSEEYMGYYTKKVYQVALKCRSLDNYPGKNVLTKLFSKLSNSIHGYSWNGQSVLIYTRDLEPNDRCILASMCEEIGINSQLSDSPPQ